MYNKNYSKQFIDLCAMNAHQRVFKLYNGQYRTDKVSEHDKKQIRADVRRVLSGRNAAYLHKQWISRKDKAGRTGLRTWSGADPEERLAFIVFVQMCQYCKECNTGDLNSNLKFKYWPSESPIEVQAQYEAQYEAECQAKTEAAQHRVVAQDDFVTRTVAANALEKEKRHLKIAARVAAEMLPYRFSRIASALGITTGHLVHSVAHERLPERYKTQLLELHDKVIELEHDQDACCMYDNLEHQQRLDRERSEKQELADKLDAALEHQRCINAEAAEAQRIEKIARAGFDAARMIERMLPHEQRTLTTWEGLSPNSHSLYLQMARKVADPLLQSSMNATKAVYEPTRDAAHALGISFNPVPVKFGGMHPIAAPNWHDLPGLWRDFCFVVFCAMRAKNHQLRLDEQQKTS